MKISKSTLRPVLPWLICAVFAMLLIAAGRSEPKGRYLFGVLKADPTHRKTDYAAGIRLAEIGIHWDLYEPRRGEFDTEYRDRMMKEIEEYKRAGYEISVATATQYTPQWVKADPALQHWSQFLGDTSGMANLVFNGPLRSEAARFIADVVAHAGLVNYYRVGLSHHGETVYPVAKRGEWWAMDPMAQGDIPGRPSTILDPPFKHWVPGMPLENRQATQGELLRWWSWYFDALVDAHDWEIHSIRAAGFSGPVQVVVPGPAIRPLELQRRLQNGLAFDVNDQYHLMNVGAVWYLFLDRLRERQNLMIDISSVYDNSGQPRGNGCEPGDDKVDYLHDPEVEKWSSTRWISFNARRNGFPTIGENPGSDDENAMQNAVRLMEQCQLTGLQWAFDDELYDGKHATIDEYAKHIQMANH